MIKNELQEIAPKESFKCWHILIALVLAMILAGSVGCGRHSVDTVGEAGQLSTSAALQISSQDHSENIQHQLEVLARNAGQWRSARDADANEGYNEIYYLITDLDQNGRLEVMGHESLGLEEKEISLGCYEVNSAEDGIVKVETAQLGDTFVDDFYDLGDGLYSAYYDPETGEYHYVMEDHFIQIVDDWDVGDMPYREIVALTLKQGKMSREVLAYQAPIKNVTTKKQYRCYRMDGSRETEISRGEYTRESVGDLIYADCEKLTVRIPCFSFYHNQEDTTEEQMIHTMEKAYQDFSVGYPLGKQECILSGQSILPEQYRGEVEEEIMSEDYQEILSGLKMQYLIPYPDVDWEAYRYTLLASEYQSLQDYMPVLLGKTDFTWTPETFTEQEEETVKTEEISIYQFLEKYGEPIENYREYCLSDISISDVTQDGKAELVLHFSSYGGVYLILHRDGERFYGTDRSERCFQLLRENGIYQKAGGAACEEFYQMRFQGERLVESMVGQRDGQKYYIDGRKVEEKEFVKWRIDNIDEPVCQYAPEGRQESGEAGQ